MPLKFLKKCRQYNVTSKSLFVISVHHLLDTTTTVDCTISSESKGQECLDNVCTRLLIQQPEFFGLRYVVKGKEDEMKWIDLERSLSRQLEKYAAGTKIFLRVRHYVTTGVRHLSDEVTRYYYFLQLKNDIYEGKIACDIRTAILLALYCRQAEYDSYQSDKQSKDYLKKSLVLPKNLQGLANDDNLLDSLILEVLQQHSGIQHLTTSQAEEMYIQCCQQLEGYGEERFQAKDNLGNDINLGLAINGMVVTAENGRQYFPWKDFHTVTIDKRTIRIEQNKSDGSLFVGSFIFSEADTARYFWKLCITQHKFFKRYIDEDSSSSMGDVESANGISIGGGAEAINSSAFSGYDLSDSREDLLLEQRAIYVPGANNSVTIGGGNGGYQHATGTPQQAQDYISSVQSLHHQSNSQLPPHGMINSANSSSALMSSNISLAASHQSGSGGGRTTDNNGINGSALHMQGGGHLGGSQLGQSWLSKEYSHDYVSSSQHLSNSILDTRLQSSSCQDLSNNNLHSSSSFLGHNNNHLLAADAHERERLKAMLPTYRPAPDYETAVQLKYRSPSNELYNLNQLQYQAAALAAHNSAAVYYAGSQPDVHQAGAGGGESGLMLGHLATHRYPDVAQPAQAMHAQYNLNAASQVAGGGSAQGNNVYVDVSQRLQMMRTKPPPPYPVNRLSSSSTPDLAVASHRTLLGYRAYVSGSSPDLVSNRNLLNSQYPYGGGAGGGQPSGLVGGHGGQITTSSGATMLHQYPYMGHMGHSQSYLPPHGTFENLNMIEEQPSIMSQLRQSALSQAAAAAAQAAANNQNNYEQNSSPTLPPSGYRSSSAQQQQQQSTQAAGVLQRNAMNGSIEPIYENVPLPHYQSSSSVVTPPQRNTEQRSSGSSSTYNSEQAAMRNRTSSIQSAPGGIHQQQQQPPVPAARHHHLQQQQPQYLQQAPDEPDEISMNIKKFSHQTQQDRAASTDMQLLDPTPPQRAMRAASAAPAIGQTSSSNSHDPPITPIKVTPPPRQHRNMKNSSSSTVSAADLPPASTSSPMSSSNTTSRLLSSSMSHEDSLQQQFSTMNLSSSSSHMYNSTLDTTTQSSSTANSSSKPEKRKKRWNFLGRSKTPDKQKSATLGREKASNTTKLQKIKLAQDDLNLHHRWSTGVPKLQPISGQFSKDKLSQILNDKLNDSQLFMEFEGIPKRRDMARYDCALLEENAMKNSDPNFLPYEDNRVRLTPTMENRHGYVNASHISATVGNKQRFYIVAQSPHEELTTRIFWQCVWEADVYLIVQLSEDLNYIPPNTNQRMEFGQFQVYQEFSQTTDRCITSKLRLYHIQSRRYRSVWHLNYTDWGEQNCPRDVNHFLDFLEELNSVRMASINEVPPGHNTNPPVLLHCLEGGGRSGVTLTADLLLYTLDHNEDLDIPRVIGNLRHQRDNIIPSLAQYKFIYSLLITYLKRTRLI
ncbi:tyrosine-protein phosphatase non-receptor type 21 [Musca vetustissima]|uniref:tyrosine-protein phosphatase non-receptor type 21 n=1 Tax=Musca vetustissima TaxID=27455 RepID=UPI002AB72F6D|nr:tyrosine-protein phosphatase non-receptor type 21 [Musca vetustissima]